MLQATENQTVSDRKNIQF